MPHWQIFMLYQKLGASVSEDKVDELSGRLPFSMLARHC
jgi:hypothetical protein